MASRNSKTCAGLLAPAIAIPVILLVPLYKNVGSHCDYTGSTKTWTELPFGIRINESYERSSLEEFVLENYPTEFERKWVGTHQTEKGVFGHTITLGCGTPNALFGLTKLFLDEFVRRAPRDEVKDFYDLLVRDDREEIRGRVRQLYEESWVMLRDHWEKDCCGEIE